MKGKLSRAIDWILGGEQPQRLLVKVPEVGLLFWLIKITSTAMGEALADWLDGPSNVIVAGLGSLVALAAFVLALRWQFKQPRYKATPYWLAVAMVATFGTMAADSLHQFLGAPYWSTTAFYAIVLGLVFWRWSANEHTLSIHSIDTWRREKFYWGTVLATFALGTATGDWTAGNLKLGFFSSALMFCGLILIPAIAYLLGANPILTFWTAYVLTRPLGASFADWFDYPKRLGGLGINHIYVWGSLGVIMVALVSLLVARTSTIDDEAMALEAEPATLMW